MPCDHDSDALLVAKFEFKCEPVSSIKKCMEDALDYLRRVETENLIPSTLGIFYNFKSSDILFSNFGAESLHLVANVAFVSETKETYETLTNIFVHISELMKHLKAKGDILFNGNPTLTITEYLERKSYRRVFRISAPEDLTELELFSKVFLHRF